MSADAGIRQRQRGGSRRHRTGNAAGPRGLRCRMTQSAFPFAHRWHAGTGRCRAGRGSMAASRLVQPGAGCRRAHALARRCPQRAAAAQAHRARCAGLARRIVHAAVAPLLQYEFVRLAVPGYQQEPAPPLVRDGNLRHGGQDEAVSARPMMSLEWARLR